MGGSTGMDRPFRPYSWEQKAMSNLNLFLKNYSSPSGDKAGENPFERKSKIVRSPTLKDSHQQQHLQMVTPTTNETTASQVKEKIVDNSAIIERLNHFEKLCQTLQKQVNELKSENQRLQESLIIKEKNKDLPMETATPVTGEFHTDEEELEHETDWILHKNKKKNIKKRKAECSPELDTSVETSKSVRETINVLKTKEKETAKIQKPPPVILSNVNDFNTVQNVMLSQNIKYEVKLLNNKQLSINVNSDNDYRSLTKAINEAKFEWHSYENKATRPCKVIARGLHPTCKPENILEDLKALGFKALSVVNLKKKKKENEKQITISLPLFMLIFDHSEDITKVFSITHIVKTKVKIEAIRKQKERIPQCKRCQRFGHTKAFCNREVKCVKCAGSHLTIDCTLDRKAPPKCSNCHEAHPANYRGCAVIKELQKRRLAKKKGVTTKPKQQKKSTSKTVKGVSYSDVARKNISNSASNPSQTKKSVTPKTNQKTQTSQSLGKNSAFSNKQISPKKRTSNEELFITSMERMLTMMDKISARLERIENRYAEKHIGTPRSILK